MTDAECNFAAAVREGDGIYWPAKICPADSRNRIIEVVYSGQFPDIQAKKKLTAIMAAVSPEVGPRQRKLVVGSCNHGETAG